MVSLRSIRFDKGFDLRRVKCIYTQIVMSKSYSMTGMWYMKSVDKSNKLNRNLVDVN